MPTTPAQMDLAMNFRTYTFGLLCCLTISSSVGCNVFGNKPKSSSDKSWSITKLWKKEYQKPNTVSVIWSPDVLTMTGQPPTRGFGGRVFFYNDRTQAIPVEGDLIVHGYRGDPMLGESEQVQADKTFRFTAEQLTGHFSPSELGASYSVWIPWDSADGIRTEVTLIPTFKGTDGQIVQGAPAKLFLPGRSSVSASAKGGSQISTSSGFETQTVSYQQRSIPTNASGSLPQMARQTEPTIIELPALGTLGRPQARGAGQPVQGFTLGTPPNAAPNASNSTGTTGSRVPGLNQPTPAAPTSATEPFNAGSAMSPAINGAPAANGNSASGVSPASAVSEKLPTAGSMRSSPNIGTQGNKPFALQPWNARQ